MTSDVRHGFADQLQRRASARGLAHHGDVLRRQQHGLDAGEHQRMVVHQNDTDSRR